MHQKAHSLTSLGHPLNNSLVAIAITLALPTSYSTIWTILLSNLTLNTETVISQVLIEEHTHAPAQMALTVTTPKGVSTTKHKSQKKNKKTEKCHYCKRVGHYEYECRKKKRDEMAKEKNEKSENLKGSDSSTDDKGKQKEHIAHIAQVAQP